MSYGPNAVAGGVLALDIIGEIAIPSEPYLHSRLDLLSALPEGIPEAVKDRRCLRWRSSAGSSSLEFIEVHKAPSFGPDKLQPPTPSKSRSIPTLPANANPPISRSTGTTKPWSETTLLPLLLRFFRLWTPSLLAWDLGRRDGLDGGRRNM
ncbi:MAG: hypothetical protein M1813_009049 [Trichoglossum hirsutum]|nr:MAG: hypothetical protein M1813_009049 [Trichoglossum hirsutum]